MTINKNFVVRNGLEVAQTLLCADDETNRVGINSANPKFELDLYGDLRINGGLSVGGTTGRPGEYLESTGDALEWKAIPVLRVVETYTAVSGQVTFPATGFLPYAGADFIDVFVDGVKLSQDEYTSNPGNTRIELVAPAFADETVELVAYNASSIGVGGSGIQGITVGEEGVVVGTAGQVTTLNFVGASLTAIGSGAGVTVYFDNVVPGIATYASFSGVATYASTSRVTIKDSGSTIGIAGTIDFGDNLTVSALSAGIVTITAAASGGTSSQWVTTSTGIHTTSNVGVGTTNAGEKLQVDGNIRVGISTTSNYIAFRGTTFDGPGNTGGELPYQHTYVGERIYDYSGNGERSELLLFKGNDVSGGDGPDRIRLLAGEHRFDVLGFSTTGTFEQVGLSTAAVNRLTITSTGVGIGTTNATSALTVRGTSTLETLNVSGVSTFGVNLDIKGFGDDSIIEHTKASNGDLYLLSKRGVFIRTADGEASGYFRANGAVELYYDNSKKFETLGTGVTITGTTFTNQLNVSGVSTLNSLSIGKLTNLTDLSSGDNPFNANNIINVGGDMAIFHLNDGTFGTSNRILLNENDLIIGTKGEVTGNTYYSSLIEVKVGDDLGFPNTSNVALGHGTGGYKLQTLGTGVTITGTTFTNQLSVSGVVTATTFVGNFSGSITDATNLTGGTANASSLNVSGIATISAGRIQADASSNLRFGNLPAGSGSGRNIAIGDQVLFSLSGGQGRNIGIGELSYYDTTTGQYNIGIGERAGQKVSTGSYNVILGAYDGNSGNLDIRTSSRNVVIADGEGNIRQYINSSGNVGIKTTVVTEALTVAGVVSATSFYGTLNAGQLTGSLPAIDGSALIGVVGSGSGVVIEDDATPVGTAGTINFGSNLSVSFGSGIATVSGASSVSEATTAYALAGTPNIYVGITTVNYLRAGSYSDINNAIIIASDPAGSVSGNINVSSKELQIAANGFTNGDRGNIVFYRKESFLNKSEIATLYSDTGNLSIDGSLTSNGNSDNTFIGNVKVGTAITLSNSGHINATGVITATSFYGSGANLTSLPAGQLTGSLPAIDGSALLNVTAAGTGVAVKDDGSTVGSATTIDFGTGLDVTFSAGIATITASGGSLQSRTTVTGVTTSIANNGIGNTNITGFKSYALMKVGLSTAGWLRLYTDSASRAADASRSVGIDPAPGSGVIAEVVTTGISTTQIISPFVMGGNLDNPADTTIYAAITNLSGSTQAITANLTILQLEA